MWRDPTTYRIFVLGTLLVGTILPGCHTGHGIFGVDCLADIPPGAIAQPVGTYACQWQVTQEQLAEQDDFVIYGYEWADGAQPSMYGKDHLEAIAQRLPYAPVPVVIERSGEESLDQARKQAVVNFLAAEGYEAPEEMVVVGKSAAEGLYGFEAPIVARGFASGSSSLGGQQAAGSGLLGGTRSLGAAIGNAAF